MRLKHKDTGREVTVSEKRAEFYLSRGWEQIADDEQAADEGVTGETDDEQTGGEGVTEDAGDADRDPPVPAKAAKRRAGDDSK